VILIVTGCSKTTPATPEEPPKTEDPPVTENPLNENPQNPSEGNNNTSLKDPVLNPLTGLYVEKDALYQRPVGIMFGNSRIERPQSGIDGADIVYEILAEGGITRLFGIFMAETRDKIGPVRSARHYNLDFLMAHNGIFIYFGGSDRLWAEIPKYNINGINGITDGYAFWRALDRKAPYNAYTSTMRIINRSEMLNYWKKVEIPQKYEFYKEKTIPTGNNVKKLEITYPISNYKVNWLYNSEDAKYYRSINNQPHKDKETEEHLKGDNIIVVFVKSWPIPNDKEGRIDMETVGSGKGHLFTGGTEVEINWSKSARDKGMIFTYKDGSVMKLNPGKTWIQVVPLNGTVTLGRD
jgi:hypothetical protein